MKKIIKSLMCIIIFLAIGIISKKNYQYKLIIKEKMYEDTINFTQIEKIYNKYLGGIFPIEPINQASTIQVFNEKLTYKNISAYKEGAQLEVEKNYLIPNLENGIITYIGEKEDYGNVIIIETENETNIWYGNVCNYNIKLYDHLSKGDIIGETCTDKLFLLYKKDNIVLDYNKYLN